MDGYKVAVVILATLLMVMAGALFFVLAEREGGDARTAPAPVVTNPAPAVRNTSSGGGSPAPSNTGTTAGDVDVNLEDDDTEVASDGEPADDGWLDICSSCGGERQVLCGVCGGDGLMPYPCPRCGGDGLIQPSPVDPMLVRCPDCHGTGRLQVPCTRCGGDGTYPCPHCGGTGIDPD